MIFSPGLICHTVIHHQAFSAMMAGGVAGCVAHCTATCILCLFSGLAFKSFFLDLCRLATNRLVPAGLIFSLSFLTSHAGGQVS